MTAQAAEELTKLFGFNIPQRWSIAHLYQAILNNESHIGNIAHITTLAGYIHHALTGVNAIGVGEASGMFPIDDATGEYNERMLDQFDALIAGKNLPWKIRDVLPKPLMAGENAGSLTKEGRKNAGWPPRRGRALRSRRGRRRHRHDRHQRRFPPRTGNVSAGTSIFAMVVLEHPLKNIYPEIDIVATPAGKPTAMVHCNNCTNDINAWVSMLRETAELFGAKVNTGDLYTMLYKKSLEGAADCDGVLVYNYMAGEGRDASGFRPPAGHAPPGQQLYAGQFHAFADLWHTMATMCIGMELLHKENVAIDSLTGPRRPVQDPRRGPALYGGGLQSARHLHGNRRRGRPLRHGAAGGLHGLPRSGRKPGRLSEQQGVCRRKGRNPCSPTMRT